MPFNKGVKYITVQDLEDVLSQFPPETWLVPNRVGNFSVYTEDGNIGYIDILEGKFEPTTSWS
jgi:hypothetical protein